MMLRRRWALAVLLLLVGGIGLGLSPRNQVPIRTLSTSAVGVPGLAKAQPNTFHADQFCAKPGVLDESCLNNAEKAAATTRGLVIVPAGTFVLRGTVTLASGVTTQGAGIDKSILRQADGRNLDTMVTTPDGASRVTFTNCTVDGNAARNTGPGQRFGVLFHSCADCTAQRLKVTNMYGLNGHTGNALAFGEHSTHAVVEECVVGPNLGHLTMSRGWPETHQEDGIFVKGANARVLNNYVEGATDTAIVAEGAADWPVTNPLIEGNTVINSVQGIAWDNATRDAPATSGRVAKNTLSGTGAYGAYSGQAIYILRIKGLADSQGRSTAVVTENTIHDTSRGAGIRVEESNTVTVSYNKLTNIGGRGSGFHFDGIGIYVTGSDRFTICNNQVFAAGENGIALFGVSDSTVCNNIVRDSSQAQGRAVDGILIYDELPASTSAPPTHGRGSARINVFGNTSTGASQRSGLRIDGKASQIAVGPNNLSGNGVSGYVNVNARQVR